MGKIEIEKEQFKNELKKHMDDFVKGGGSIEELKPQIVTKQRAIAKDLELIANKMNGRLKPLTLAEYYEMYSAEWLIEQFALWANLPAGMQLQFPKKSAFYLYAGSGGINLPLIDQETIIFIESCINSLADSRDVEKQALELYFIKRRNYESIGKALACSESTARNRVVSAIDFIDGRLSMFLELKAA